MVHSSGSSDPDGSPAASPDPQRPRRASPVWTARRTTQLVALAVVLVALAGVALALRAHNRKRVVAEGLTRAEELFARDTSAGYREASDLLEPLVPLDPVTAGAARAFALAMLAADYRDGDAALAAEALLGEAAAVEHPPTWADLATSMLAVGRQEAGSALAAANRAGDGPWARVVQARVALLADKPEVAREPLDAAVRERPAFAPALALRGDVLRRTGHAVQAAESYRAALAASPHHPRATYGLAKLALSGAISADEARAALERLASDTDGTPAVERARAAYLLASVEARRGDKAASAAAMELAGVAGPSRAWLERAVAAHASSRRYAVQDGAPPELASASDDDPYVAPPKPPPSTAISPTFRLPDPPRASAGKMSRTTGAKAAKNRSTSKNKATAKTAPGKKSAAKKIASPAGATSSQRR